MIQFELDQVKAILLHLDEIPHKYSANLIKYIRNIAEPQVAKIQQSDVAEIQQPFPQSVAEIQQ
jgi:hypothetical protein